VIVDVSPGPAMYEELDAVGEFSTRIAFSAADYFARLDALVVKYAAGSVQARARAPATRVELIPNGVPRRRARPSRDRLNLIAAGRIAPRSTSSCCSRRCGASPRPPDCELDVAGRPSRAITTGSIGSGRG
jgi:hypothetical protein